MRPSALTAFGLALLLALPAQPVADAPVPLSYFRLPISVAGTPQPYVSVSGRMPPGAATDAYYPPFTAADTGTFFYGVAPAVPSGHPGVQGYYSVTIFKTVEDAGVVNGEARAMAGGSSGPPFVPLAVPRAVNATEWLRRSHAVSPPNGLYCAVDGGVQYRNLELSALVVNTASRPTPGQAACSAEAQWVLRVLRALYPRVVRFAAAHPSVGQPPALPAIRVVEPFDAHGRPAAGYSAGYTPTALPSGYCWTTSDVSGRADAYRCLIGSQIIDPCFSPPGIARPSVVGCVRDPRRRIAVFLHLTRPLPTHYGAAVPPEQGQPWAIELTTGELCVAAQGATTTASGLRLAYGCAPLGAVYGSVGKGHLQWTVLVWRGASFAQVTRARLARVGVAVAWY